jgi:hypothetical protein
MALRDDPGYPALIDRLERLAREQLGPAAEIERDPPLMGGVLGRAGGQHVDYTLPAISERHLQAMGAEVERLWS